MNNHIDTEVARERSKTYRGTAKIPLNQIMIHCELDPKNVTRLSRVFEKEGCRRLDMRNHVTALVSELHLADALNSAGLDAGTLMTIQPGEYPFLQFLPGQIRCLHGRHRLEAGKIILAQSEQWWTVDLYLDGSLLYCTSTLLLLIKQHANAFLAVISTNLQTVLIEEYANERKPHDGEIYRKIRQYQLEGNVQFVERWKLRLSSQNKLKRLQQLSARVEVREAFDALLPITGLWAGLNIGSLHRMLALKCDEVLSLSHPTLSVL